VNVPRKKTKRINVKPKESAGKEDKLLGNMFGTDKKIIVDGLLRHCFSMLSSDEVSATHSGNDERAFLVSIIAEIKPRDSAERMLAVQIVATHLAMVRAGRWLSNSTNLPQAQTHTNGYTKLARTYTAQMEALRKHRNGGKQTVVVQHVNVEDGGQAIVGTVQRD
jgi:hypothetical protein